MNNGKICVPVCAKTAEEMIKQIDRASEFADVIELRFDCLEDAELDKAISSVAELECEKPFLVTFRPKNKHSIIHIGVRKYKDDEEKQLHLKYSRERTLTWDKLLNLKNAVYVDFEEDLYNSYYWDLMTCHIVPGFTPSDVDFETAAKLKEKRVIASEHFFSKPTEPLENTYENLTALRDEDDEFSSTLEYLRYSMVKIASQADEITDALEVWKLLDRGKKDTKEIIPIAMGEAGKWTRILGLAHGAYLTYAALDDESGTAPGQISAKDMRDVYRVKELNLETEVYGIIGENTSHSQSPYIHNAAFKAAGRNAVYIPLQVTNLEEFMRRMVLPSTREVELNFHGFSVTIPHKQAIMGYLDEIDETAKAIGAVNTVKILDGKLYGYNTDAEGFINPLINAFGDLKGAKVALLGAGGAARACVYALKNAGADTTIFARDIAKAKTLGDEFGVALNQLQTTGNQLPNFDILVNSTPVGMKGKSEGESPVDAESLKGLKLVYDLVYTPEETKLLADAENFGIKTLGGMKMLLNQAAAQQKIWTVS